MSIRDRIKPMKDPGRISCIKIARDYGDWEIEFDMRIEP